MWKIQNNVLGVIKEKLLIDVDGSLIQVYMQGSNKITVQNDYMVGAVYVESEVEISVLDN